MIHVAIVCETGRNTIVGPHCPAYQDTVPLDDVARWYAATLAEHAWTVDDDGNTYCPRHNPADDGAPITLTSESYMPLGDSGWEARALVPDFGSEFDVSFATIEIRQRRGGDDD